MKSSEGIEVLREFVSIGLATLVCPFFAVSAFAAPVTAKDLSGKKICWDDGLVGTFSPGGKYHSSLSGAGTWEVTSVGVQIRTERFSGLYDIDRQPDGALKSLTRHSSGHYCN
jgi:hypothetical protein